LPALDCLVCRVEAAWCALPLRDVGEVMRPLAVEHIEAAPPFVLGLTVIRGQAVPVVDLGHLLMGESTTITRFVSLRVQGRGVALAVSEVLGTRSLSPDELSRVPSLLGEGAEFRAALGALDGHLVSILQSARLVERLDSLLLPRATA
jgi:purine-binding chemotaxis protein CheW